MNVFQKIKSRLSFLYVFTTYKKIGKTTYLGKKTAVKGRKYISIGNRVSILKGWRFECYDNYGGVKYKPNLQIGDNVSIGYNFQCLVNANCQIGDNTLIASNVLITTENHGMDARQYYYSQPLTYADVSIGKNCWIGEKATILPGVSIGNNCIVGAGSVVTSSFGDNLMIVGCPARAIKKFDFDNQRWVTNE